MGLFEDTLKREVEEKTAAREGYVRPARTRHFLKPEFSLKRSNHSLLYVALY